jgi:starch phosphorylase
VRVETKGKQHAYEVQVYLNDLDPKAVRVELCADAMNADAPGGYVFIAAVSAARAVSDYTARVIPYCPGVAVPQETAQILWQH